MTCKTASQALQRLSSITGFDWVLQLFTHSSTPQSNLLLNGPKQIPRAFPAPHSAEQFKPGWLLPQMSGQVLPSFHVWTCTATCPPSLPTYAELYQGTEPSLLGKYIWVVTISGPVSQPGSLQSHRNCPTGLRKEEISNQRRAEPCFLASPSLSWLWFITGTWFSPFSFFEKDKVSPQIFLHRPEQTREDC